MLVLQRDTRQDRVTVRSWPSHMLHNTACVVLGVCSIVINGDCWALADVCTQWSAFLVIIYFSLILFSDPCSRRNWLPIHFLCELYIQHIILLMFADFTEKLETAAFNEASFDQNALQSKVSEISF